MVSYSAERDLPLHRRGSVRETDSPVNSSDLILAVSKGTWRAAVAGSPCFSLWVACLEQRVFLTNLRPTVYSFFSILVSVSLLAITIAGLES